MAKLPQQLHVVHSCQSQSQPIRCDFCGGDHLNGHYFYQNNSLEAEVNYKGIRGGKVVSSIIKVLSNNNHNPYNRQLLKD